MKIGKLRMEKEIVPISHVGELSYQKEERPEKTNKKFLKLIRDKPLW